jgi:integrase
MCCWDRAREGSQELRRPPRKMGDRRGCGSASHDTRTLRGLRDLAALSVLVGCALRRRELAALNVSDLQRREGRALFADIVGKGGHIRTVPVPNWVYGALTTWLKTAPPQALSTRARAVRKASCDALCAVRGFHGRPGRAYLQISTTVLISWMPLASRFSSTTKYDPGLSCSVWITLGGGFMV